MSKASPDLWVAPLPVLAIAGFAACLCAAAWPRRWPAVWAGRWPRATPTIGAAALGLVPGAAVVWPAAGGGLRPLPGEASVRLARIGLAAVVLVAVVAVHWWRWRLGFDRVQLALVVACLLGAGALEVIRQHHERFDGQGYPDGLAGSRSRWPPDRGRGRRVGRAHL
jgi:hypothetical protein